MPNLTPRLIIALTLASTVVLVFGDMGRTAENAAQADRKLPQLKEIQGRSIHTVLPKDAIPAIDDPHFVSAEDVDFIKPREPVIGIVRGNEAKAYSTWQLDRHEIVNDTIDGKSVAVTW